MVQSNIAFTNKSTEYYAERYYVAAHSYKMGLSVSLGTN